MSGAREDAGAAPSEWEQAAGGLEQMYVFRLYIAGDTARSRRAIESVRRLCEENLQDRYELEVIDLHANPELAREDQIVASPTLLRELPLPLRRLIGDLSHAGPEVLGLDLQTVGPRDSHTSEREQA